MSEPYISRFTIVPTQVRGRGVIFANIKSQKFLSTR